MYGSYCWLHNRSTTIHRHRVSTSFDFIKLWISNWYQLFGLMSLDQCICFRFLFKCSAYAHLFDELDLFWLLASFSSHFSLVHIYTQARIHSVPFSFQFAATSKLVYAMLSCLSSSTLYTNIIFSNCDAVSESSTVVKTFLCVKNNFSMTQWNITTNLYYYIQHTR